jgi:restriction endonuclease S subunit
VINSTKINSETLLALFKSEPIQSILKQNCSGTILTAINKTEFQNIPLPLIEKEIQQQIAELIKKSFYLCGESKRLLDEAKDMVEKEIEKEN